MGRTGSSETKAPTERVREAERRVAMQRNIVQQRWQELVQALDLLNEYEDALMILTGARMTPRRK